MAADFTLRELAAHVGGRVHGDAERRMRGVATLEAAGPDDLSFLTNPRYRAAAGRSRAGALLVGPRERIAGPALLEVAEPYLALARLLELFHPPPPRPSGVSPRAFVDPEAVLGAGVAVGPFAVVEARAVLGERVALGAGAVVGAGSRVGADSEIRPGAVLYPGTRVGARCLVHAGVVLGADGYGFATVGGVHHKIPQLGHVELEDDVEIGANSAVDRGALGPTVVGRGSKLDDLVMIAHGVRLGEGALIAAQSGIAGSTRVGGGAVFAGQSGAAGHLRLGRGATVAAKSAVLDDLPDGAFVAGVPAIDHRVWKRAQAAFRRLPELLRELRAMRERVAALERRLGGAGREDER